MSLWDHILTPKHINCTTQLRVICKTVEGVLSTTAYVIDEDIK